MKTMVITYLFFFPLTLFAQDRQKSWSLRQCIEFALQHHSSVRIYENEQQIASQKTRQALSGYLPQVTVNSDFENNLKRQVSVLPAGILGPEATRIAFGTRYSSNFTLELKQPVYDRPLLVEIEAALPNRQMAALNAQQNMENLVYTITRAYYQVLISKTELSLLLSNSSMYGKLLPGIQLQVDKGVLPKIEVERIYVNMHNMESNITAADYMLRQSVNELKYDMGLDDDSDSAFIINDTLINRVAKADVDNEFDYTKQIAYRIAQVNITIQTLEMKRIQAGRIPRLNLYARYGTQALNNDFNKIYRSMSDYSYIGIRLTIPIFDGFSRNSQYNQAKFGIINARENLKLNVAGLKLQYANSIEKMRQAELALDNNERNIGLAKKVFATTTLQYQKGIIPLSDLLNAELALREAENIYLKNLFNYFESKLDLEKASGSLLQFYGSL